MRPLATFFLLLFASAAAAQSAPTLSAPEAQSLVARALATESRAAQNFGHDRPMRYRLRKSSPRITTTKEIVETRDGDVARLIAISDQPLSVAAEQQETARLDALLADPSLQQHRKQSEENDTGRALKVLRVLPTAFVYEFAGMGAASNGGTVARFTFRPNPEFNPPDLGTGVLTAMAGELWVDPSAARVVRLAGSLLEDKQIGWGLLGELDKGGWVEINQADVGAGEWRIVHLMLKMNGRLLWKQKNSDSVQDYSQFAPVAAGIDYRQAIRLLRGETGR